MPRLRINLGKPLHEKASLSVEALKEANEKQQPDVMVRGTELTRMTERGALESFNVDSLRDVLSSASDYGRTDKENVWHSSDPPHDVAKTVLAKDSKDYEGLPRVDRVADVPVLSASGTLILDPGYHAADRLYYQPAKGLENVRPGDTFRLSEIEAAREILIGKRGLLGAFDFDSTASLANALALTLLPFVKEYIDGPMPLHMALAPQPDCGKTYLIQACLIPGCGLVSVTSGSQDKDEWRKQITSTFLSGAPALLLDNLEGKLDSGPLAAALTTGKWSDRILGESRKVTMDVQSIFTATGNNMQMSRQILRRALALGLDPGGKQVAGERTDFPHKNLHGWALENRATLASACLTLVQNWLEGYGKEGKDWDGERIYFGRDGESYMARATRGSYTKWGEVMGGILACAEVPGLDGNRDWLLAHADDDTREAAEFLRAWWEKVTDPLELKELFLLCGKDGVLRDYLPSVLTECRADQLHDKLKAWLRDNRNARFDGFKLVAENDGRLNHWYVQDRRSNAESKVDSAPDSAGVVYA